MLVPTRRIVLSLALLGSVLHQASWARAQDAAPRLDLAPRPAAGEVSRVTVRFTARGKLQVLQSGQPQELPMQVDAELRYLERTLVAGATSASGLRRYEVARARLQISGHQQVPELAAGRLVHVVADEKEYRLSGWGEPLTRQELDLIDVPMGTLALSWLLPREPVAVGSTWKHRPEAVAQWLRIDAVGSSDLQSVLLEAPPGGLYQVHVSGTAEGAVDGVATTIAVDGQYRVDPQTRRVVELKLALHEQRAMGHTGPGLNVQAELSLRIEAPLSSDQRAIGELMPLPGQAAIEPRLRYRSQEGYELLYDRRWHVVDEQPRQLTLRLVDRGELVAQCVIAPLDPAAQQPPWTLDRFQNEIQKVLGDRCQRVAAATQRQTVHGLPMYRVVVEGQVQQLPIEWRYALVGAADSRQVMVVVTLEQSLRERLDNADVTLLDGLTLPRAIQAQAADGASR
jgi:hypothetical protein